MAAECDINKALPDLVLDIDDEDVEANMSSCSDANQISTPECQDAGPSQLVNILNSKQSNYDESKPSKNEIRSTPRRAQTNNSRGIHDSVI